jgi:hypothetical protein
MSATVCRCRSIVAASLYSRFDTVIVYGLEVKERTGGSLGQQTPVLRQTGTEFRQWSEAALWLTLR